MVDILFSTIYTSFIAFIISLAVLIKSADYFTEQSEKLGLVLGIPHFIVGVTIVAIGTSLPELATSIAAVIQGTNEFVVGNAVGSNITNLMLIIGVTAFMIRRIKFEWELMQVDLPFLLGSALLLGLVGWDGMITFREGLLLIVGYIIYSAYNIQIHKNHQSAHPNRISWKMIGILLLSAIGIYFGADFTVRSISALSGHLGFADTSALALSLVALGTSLPELFTSISAARRKNYEMIMGNILGSNIFNTFIVVGIPGLFANLVVPTSVITIGLVFMVGATLLFTVTLSDKRVTIYEGSLFLMVYLLFLGKLFGFI